MSRIHRAANLAVLTIFAFAGVANSAPSFAVPVLSSVTVTNEQNIQPVPQLGGEAVEQTQPAAPAPEMDAPKAASLAQLVSQQISPETLDREAECLAASVYFESKSEPLEGQLAVAEVVINRAKAGGRFPPSICSVVFQKGQFSFVRGGGYPPINRNGAYWKTAVAIAQIAMNDDWDSRASKAMYFHAARVSPGWNKVRVAQLGNHVFYR